MSGYDLFEVPEGYETDIVLLIVPYFDPKFIKKITQKLSPKKSGLSLMTVFKE